MADMRIRPLITGSLSFVPGVYSALANLLRLGSGNTNQAQYCLNAWLTLIAAGVRHGLDLMPARVAELGPGATLGTGLAALLTGAQSYKALDLVAYANWSKTLTLLDEMAALLASRRGAVFPSVFEELNQVFDSDGWPRPILSADKVAAFIAKPQISNLREELFAAANCGGSGDRVISYRAPWMSAQVIEPDSVDLVFSNAVFEHVEDVAAAHGAIFCWLRPGGYALHRVDFGCHGVSSAWNGHWTIGPRTWKLIRGKRTYSINRFSLSKQRSALKQAGFKILGEVCHVIKSNLGRSQLAAEFNELTEQDLTCRQAILVAQKIQI